MMNLQKITKKFIDKDPSMKTEIALRRVCTAVSSEIHNARVKAGLSQKELAEKMGTDQHAINRIENESNHSLRTIVECADALDFKVSIVFTPVNKPSGTFKEALDEIWEAGGKAWDDVDDPDAYIQEMR